MEAKLTKIGTKRIKKRILRRIKYSSQFFNFLNGKNEVFKNETCRV